MTQNMIKKALIEYIPITTNQELIDQVKNLTEQVNVLIVQVKDLQQSKYVHNQSIQELQHTSQKSVINHEERDKNGWGVGNWSYLTPYD